MLARCTQQGQLVVIKVTYLINSLTLDSECVRRLGDRSISIMKYEAVGDRLPSRQADKQTSRNI